MPSRKWKKVLSKDRRSFHRRPAQNEVSGSAILVVTEGTVTEKEYFETIREKLAASTVELVTYGEGKGDPKRLIDRAAKLCHERKRKARTGKLSVTQVAYFDQTWIVFDADILSNAQLKDAFTYAQKKEICVAWSNPCFEFWLLLHLEFTSASLHNCGQAIDRLSNNLQQPYTKDEQGSRKLIPSFIINVATAVTYAERIRKHHEEANSAFPPNPFTEIDKLIRLINEAASPANKLW